MPWATITGTGSSVPEKVLTNADLEKMVETTDEWITSRTGIKERHIAVEGEFTSTFATRAAERALAMAGISAAELDLIIVGTVTPDFPFPSTACVVQSNLGAERAAAFDLSAACSGFVYGLSVAEKFIRTGAAKKALVIGAEVLTRILDWSDRNTCVLFWRWCRCGCGRGQRERSRRYECLHAERRDLLGTSLPSGSWQP